MKLRCGVTGLRRGKLFVELLSKVEGCEVVAVHDPYAPAFEDLSGVETYTDYDKFIAHGLDVVAVISPAPYHAEQALKALEQGVHVLSETPCTYDVDQARKLVALVKKTGLKYMLAEQCPWMGWAVALKALAEEGKFGDIIYAEGDYTHDCRGLMLVDGGQYIPYAEWSKHPDAKKTWRATNLPPLKYCSHTLGPLLVMMEDRASSVFALSTGGKTAPDLADVDLETALLETEKGAVIRLTNGFTVAHPYWLSCKLVGTRGSAVVQNAAGMTALYYSEAEPNGESWKELTPEMLQRPDGRGEVEVMVEEFIQSVRNDTKPPLDVYDSLEMTLPGTLAHESALKGGVKIEIPDVRQGF